MCRQRTVQVDERKVEAGNMQPRASIHFESTNIYIYMYTCIRNSALVNSLRGGARTHGTLHGSDTRTDPSTRYAITHIVRRAQAIFPPCPTRRFPVPNRTVARVP